MQTGTLKELDVQEGDVVEFVCGRVNKFRYGLPQKGDQLVADIDGNVFGMAPEFDDSIWRIISRGNQSPVREVTRKEIVAGTYGLIRVERIDDESIAIGLNGDDYSIEVSKSKLLTTISTLHEIADAMGE